MIFIDESHVQYSNLTFLKTIITWPFSSRTRYSYSKWNCLCLNDNWFVELTIFPYYLLFCFLSHPHGHPPHSIWLDNLSCESKSLFSSPTLNILLKTLFVLICLGWKIMLLFLDHHNLILLFLKGYLSKLKNCICRKLLLPKEFCIYWFSLLIIRL